MGMGFDDDLKRGLRRVAAELETGNEPLRPARSDARRGVRMRPAAAGLGMAASIAATVALFAQLLPSTQPGGAVRPGAASSTPSESQPDPTPTGAPTGDPTGDPTGAPTGDPAGAPEESPPPTPIEAPGGNTAPQSNCGPAPAVFDAYSQFRVTLDVSPASASRGEPFTFRVRLTNDGPDSTYEEGNPRAEVFVYDRQGRVVWVSSSGMAYTMELRTGTYRQGETAEVTETWRQDGCANEEGSRPAIGPGSYTARARWNGNRGGWSQPVSLEIR